MILSPFWGKYLLFLLCELHCYWKHEVTVTAISKLGRLLVFKAVVVVMKCRPISNFYTSTLWLILLLGLSFFFITCYPLQKNMQTCPCPGTLKVKYSHSHMCIPSIFSHPYLRYLLSSYQKLYVYMSFILSAPDACMLANAFLDSFGEESMQEAGREG